MKRLLFLLLLAALPAASGCVSPKAYFTDRWNDSKDIFTLSAGVGLGARARVGPVHAGLVADREVGGLRNGELGMADASAAAEMELLVIPFTNWCAECGDEDEGARTFSLELAGAGAGRGKDYRASGRLPFVTTRMRAGRSPAYFTQLEVTAGAGLSLRAGFNPGELLDFLVGWFGLDLYGDDIAARKEREADESPAGPAKSP